MKWYMIAETEKAELDPSAPKHPHLILRGHYYWLLCWDDVAQERTVESYGTNLGLMRVKMGELRFQAAVNNFTALVAELNEKKKSDHESLRKHRGRYEAALQMIHDALDGMDAIYDQIRFRSGGPTWEEEQAQKIETARLVDLTRTSATGTEEPEAASTTESSGSAIGS